MNLDTILWSFCICAEIAVIGILLYRRVWRIFPFFLSYNLWTLIGGIAAVAFFRRYSPSSGVYISFYLINLLVDSVLLFTVLVEIGWSVLKPLRGSLPRTALLVIVLLIVVAGALIWPFASSTGITNVAGQLAFLIRLRQTVAILAILAFLVLAGGSQFLSIGFRNRELQIATGLGLYSVVDMVVAALHSYPKMRPQYNNLEKLLVASFLCSLIYWIYSFAQAEQERRQMSPQAQNILLAMAGTARTTRVALANSRASSKEGQQ